MRNEPRKFGAMPSIKSTGQSNNCIGLIRNLTVQINSVPVITKNLLSCFMPDSIVQKPKVLFLTELSISGVGYFTKSLAAFPGFGQVTQQYQ